MSANVSTLATRYAGRPLLLTPRAALELANRVNAVDAGAVTKPGRFSALIRKLSGDARRAPVAMEDDDGFEPVPMETRLAYAPLYAGEPDDYGFCWTLKDGVALMQVDKPLLDRGEIFCGEVYHGYDTILQGLREASEDDRVKAIFVREATPGGVVAGGLPALAEFMREKGQRGGGKPIWVYADMACSAGYWMASSADRIIAPRVGLVGSIGAVIVHENWSGALKEAGIEITPIQFGASKTDGAWWEALSDRARADLQADIDQCGRDFVADVVKGRPQLTAEEVLATQAAVYMGHHDEAARSAVALKLVDALASEEAAFAELRDQVSGVQTSAPAGSIHAVAQRERATASAAKEASVAQKTKAAGKPSGQTPLAQAQAALRSAQAEVARLKAEEQAPPEDEEGEESEAPAASDDDGGDAAEEGAEATSAEEEEDDDGDASEAEKIAASAEADAHPKAATAAIRDGLTLAQFQNQVKALSAGGRGQLASTLSGSRRLGSDAAASGKSASIDAKAIYARRAGRVRKVTT